MGGGPELGQNMHNILPACQHQVGNNYFIPQITSDSITPNVEYKNVLEGMAPDPPRSHANSLYYILPLLPPGGGVKLEGGNPRRGWLAIATFDTSKIHTILNPQKNVPANNCHLKVD